MHIPEPPSARTLLKPTVDYILDNGKIQSRKTMNENE